MITERLTQQGIILITPQMHEDERGFFVETFRQEEFDRAIGQKTNFVQENCSFSKHQFTVRGLHAQKAPNAQGKLVSCIRGKIIDMVIDFRPGSNSYGQSLTVELTAENKSQLWVPAGFLHGFATLEPNTEVHYKCTDYYAPEHAINVFWNDPGLNLDWGFDPALAVLSDKDKTAQSFRDFELEFLNPV